MNNRKVNEPRLRKLANRLVSDDCKELFYMVDLCSSNHQEVQIQRSAFPALEAAISESVHSFPDEWVWDDENEIAYLIEDVTKDPCTSAMIFYGLDEMDFKHLFVPFNQYPELYGGKMVELLITPTHIGENIYEYLDKIQATLN
jgi:hypothetical protein